MKRLYLFSREEIDTTKTIDRFISMQIINTNNKPHYYVFTQKFPLFGKYRPARR